MGTKEIFLIVILGITVYCIFTSFKIISQLKSLNKINAKKQYSLIFITLLIPIIGWAYVRHVSSKLG